jgi:hypothetical protein
MPLKKEVSLTIKSVGIRTFYELDYIPSVFDKVTLPIIIRGKEHATPLVVTRVVPPPYRNLSRPVLVYAAFDLGFSQRRMEICSEEDIFGNIEPIHAWWFGHGLRVAELWRNALDGSARGLTTWSKEKTISADAV